MTKAIHVGATEFRQQVMDEERPVLVDFWAPWCGPCRMLAPVLEEIASDYEGKLKVVKVNVDENPSLAGSYNVSSIPTMVIFQKGEAKDRLVGFMPKGELAKRIDAGLRV